MISDRMKAICDIMNESDTVADIGCDHGYVAIELIKRNKAKHAICSDLRKGPLSRAKENVSINSLEDKIECRLSDGLKNYRPKDMDTVIIAGMGGPLIQKILNDSWEVANSVSQFVLSPQSDFESFRKYLYEHGFTIDDESIVKEDDKFYFLMRVYHADRETCMPSSVELKYGHSNLSRKDPVLNEYLIHEKSALNNLLNKLKSDCVEERIREIELLLKDNAEALSIYES